MKYTHDGRFPANDHLVFTDKDKEKLEISTDDEGALYVVINEGPIVLIPSKKSKKLVFLLAKMLAA